MIYRCRRSNYEEARGFLPTATCGMLVLAQMGVCAAVLMPTIRFGRSLIETASDSPIADSARGFGWWKLVIIPFVMIIGLVVLLFAAMLLNVLMELIE